MRCIACGCTEFRACPGGCSWISITPPKCSACFDTDGTPLALGAEEGGLFGFELCPASATPAAHVPLFTGPDACHCARCKMDLAA